jgi:hypothetical protein
MLFALDRILRDWGRATLLFSDWWSRSHNVKRLCSVVGLALAILGCRYSWIATSAVLGLITCVAWSFEEWQQGMREEWLSKKGEHPQRRALDQVPPASREGETRRVRHDPVEPAEPEGRGSVLGAGNSVAG